jgi:glucokinase
MTKTIVAWDLGATKCAAAIVEYDSEHRLNCKRYGSIKIRSCVSLEELSTRLEDMLGIKMAEADAICIGAAGQYDGDSLQLHSGYPYPMGFSALSEQYNWPQFAIVHDYSPIVCATFTPYIDQPENVRRLNEASINPLGRRVALGVGTGIGLKDGVLFPNGDFWLGTNEIGHIGVVTPPLANKIYLERHHELIKFLRSEGILADDEPLTFEKLLAGQGIVRIHSFFDREASKKSSEEIGAHVRNGHADETLALFSWYLGLLVGTVQLAFMPDGGIWLTGGVVLSHLDVFDHEDFYLGIESSPAYWNLRQQFPLGVLCGMEHAFMGSAYYVTKRLL